LSHIGEYGPGRGSRSVAPPLLVECDRLGGVLWLSAAARLAFGAAHNLVGVIPQDSAVRLSVVLETRDSVLIGAQLGDLPESVHREECFELLDLRDNLVRHCFRLQEAERGLSTRARQMRPGGGSRAVLQIDLERQRLGRDLHTGVGQTLVAIRTQLEIVAGQLPAPPYPVQAALERISILQSDALEQVRSVSRKLHPPEWLRLKLEDALRQLWEISGIAERYEASLDLKPLPYEPSLEVKVLMYRAAQESLSNLIQHSCATRVHMALEAKGEHLVLRVEDNGVGFDAAKQFAGPANVAAGIGLRSIREQTESAGGKLVIESGASGTSVEVSAPFRA
jgi:two-component system, NarL family, sensor kinase